MNKGLVIRAALLLLLAISPLAVATSKIYEVNRTIGNGTVTGFIETDGKLFDPAKTATQNALTAANILDWSLTLTSPNLPNGQPSFIELATGNTIISPLGLTATATQLIFDTTISAFFLLQAKGNNLNLWCLQSADRTCAGGVGAGEYIGYTIGGGIAEKVSLSGQVIFATVSAVPIPAPVPEPAAYALMLAGLSLLGVMVRYRKQNARTAQR